MIRKSIALSFVPVTACVVAFLAGPQAVPASGNSSDPAAAAATAAPDPIATITAHRVGQVFNYSLHGDTSQSILGRDAFGRAVDQRAAASVLTGRERIAVRQASPSGLTVHRSGAITASAHGPAYTKAGTGWTLINGDGIVVRDHGTLGGLFLLPLGFLGERAVKGGAPLAVGDSWHGKLGTKLFGMIARPSLTYRVSGTRYVLGTSVYSIEASGSAPMKEPIYTSAGQGLGYATGTARITLDFDYDRTNARVVAMDLRVQDDLKLGGGTKAPQGKVSDANRYLVALDAGSISASAISRSL